MTDRIKGLIVTLEPNVREDDAQLIIRAISLLPGVIDVQPLVADHNHLMATAQARIELQKRLWQALKDY